jgi:hypothetical protein
MSGVFVTCRQAKFSRPQGAKHAFCVSIQKQIVMVTLLSGFPPYVAAYRAWGKVEPDEYEKVVMHRVDEVAKQFGTINFLVRLETDISNYSFLAFLKYLKVSFEHFTRWNRMAIVTDEGWVRNAYDRLSPLVHGEVRGYTLDAFEAAKTWVSAPLSQERSMKLSAILNAGILGTSVMTAFSHVLSQRAGENFSEPELLAFFYKAFGLPAHRLAGIAGWHLHYTMGVSWTFLYALMLKKGWIKNHRATALAVGAASGLAAVACWRRLFSASSRRPRTHTLTFYAQLIPAHILFALMAMEVLKHENACAPHARGRFFPLLWRNFHKKND